MDFLACVQTTHKSEEITPAIFRSRHFRSHRVFVTTNHAGDFLGKPSPTLRGLHIRVRIKDEGETSAIFQQSTCSAENTRVTSQSTEINITSTKIQAMGYFIVGMIYSAPPRMPVGQREVTVFKRV